MGNMRVNRFYLVCLLVCVVLLVCIVVMADAGISAWVFDVTRAIPFGDNQVELAFAGRSQCGPESWP